MNSMNSEEALCLDFFDKFCVANTFFAIVTQFHKLCAQAHVEPARFPDFFPKLKAKLSSLDAQQFLSTYDKKVQNPTYQRGTICRDLKVLIIGAGPSGLRCAIECQLLGAKVVLIEKRDVFSRNNVLHIWPFVIQDLKCLGAKRFYPKFCAGSINHISISQLQHVLLKIALLLGVEVHAGLGFEKLVEPRQGKEKDSTGSTSGWQITCELEEDSELDVISAVESQHFDVIIGANGRQCNLPGFKRKALRAKLAIAITANFVNHRTAAEARVEEISGVSFIFRQSFFEELYDLTGIDLENIVYYKDETHYFIMTAKKASLLMKGVLKQDFAETDDLLHSSNVDRTALKSYILEAVTYATENKLPILEFALNYRGEPDFSLFDFTSMYASENASKILERNGRRLHLALVGDSLLEPFWPMGTGCARGFLSALDAAWMIRSLAKGNSPLDVISERESIFKLLAQTTQENLNRNYSNYSVDPHSRYQNISIQFGKPYPIHIQELYDTGTGTGTGNGKPNWSLTKSNQIITSAVAAAELPASLVGGPDRDQRSRAGAIKETKTKADEDESKITSAVLNNGPGSNVISKSLNQSQEQLQIAERQRHSEQDLESKSVSQKIDFLMEWIQSVVRPFRIDVRGIHDLFVRGDALCCLIHAFRPDLIPQFPFPPDVEEGIELVDAAAFRNQLAFDFLQSEYGITCAESGLNSTLYSFTNVPVLVDFLVQVYVIFRDESPQVTATATATAASSAKDRLQRKSLWEPTANRNPPKTTTVGSFLSTSIRRSATAASAIDSRHRREQFRNSPPSFERTSSCSQRGPGNGDGNAAPANSNYRFEKSPDRDRARRQAEAEETKNRAIQFMNSLKERRAEQRKANKEAITKAIRSLDGCPKRAVEAPTEAEATAAQVNQSTLEQQDDFFNEYNLRLWRKSVPTIQERSQKLENNLLESAGLSLKKSPASASASASNSSQHQQGVVRKSPHIGKINEQALSIMQQKFAENKGYTDHYTVHLQPKPTSPSRVGPGPAPSSSACPQKDIKPNPDVRVQTPAPSSSRSQDTKNKPEHASCNSNRQILRKEDLDEEQLAKTMFTSTNKRDGHVLTESVDDVSLQDLELDDLEEEFDEDTLNDLSKAEVDEILNWSGKYL